MIRLKTKKNDIKRVTLHYQDKYIPVQLMETRAQVDMEKVASDKRYYI